MSWLEKHKTLERNSLLLLAVVRYTADYRRLTAYFIGGMIGSFVVLMATGYLVEALH